MSDIPTRPGQTPDLPAPQLPETFLTREWQAAICFGLGVLGIGVMGTFFPPDSTPREQWLWAFLLILGSCGMFGAAVGSMVGHGAIGFVIGFVLPVVLFVGFIGFGALC
jgi:hypothetical protein